MTLRPSKKKLIITFKFANLFLLLTKLSDSYDQAYIIKFA